MAAATVLVVDDDPGIRFMMRMALEDEGYAVDTAADGQEALDQIEGRQPKVVLLDLQMPVMNGWQLQERLRQRQLNVPLIFMTAGTQAQAEAERYHAAGYLAKPFDLDGLFKTVSRFTAQASA